MIFMLCIVGISSADSYFLNLKVADLGLNNSYTLIKLVFALFFILLLFYLSGDKVKALALITSPLVIAVFYRHGFDFFSLFPCLALISKKSDWISAMILAISIFLYFWVKEISILFTILFVIAFISLKQKIWIVSILSILFLALMYFFLPLELLMDIQGSVIKKITATEYTHVKNSDFSIYKAFVVYLLSHSYFIFNNNVTVAFAGLTCLPIVFLTLYNFLRRAPKNEIFLSFFIYIFTTSFFKTFQHLRIYPFLYFNYFNYLSRRDCYILVWINVVTLLLHQFIFLYLDPDKNSIFLVFF
ncbi:hypothetical protein N9803_02680 [Gammaproteobacteria bacterium]|nr:hypothetical protein [Gammaproteobacteria bacterium]